MHNVNERSSSTVKINRTWVAERQAVKQRRNNNQFIKQIIIYNNLSDNKDTNIVRIMEENFLMLNMMTSVKTWD